MKPLFTRILCWFKPADNTPAEILRAKQLIIALDSGGLPLDPAIIVRIAEDLGLEVSKKARMEDTIERIRAASTRY